MGKRAERKRSKESRLRHEAVYKRSQLEGDLPDEDDTDDKEAAMADPVSTETGEKRFFTEDELRTAAKCDEMTAPMRPYGGAKTWDELDAYQKAADAQMAIEDVDAQFMALKANVMGDMMLEDKAGALVDAMDGFLARMKAVGKKEAAAAVVPPVPPPPPESTPAPSPEPQTPATPIERFKAWFAKQFGAESPLAPEPQTIDLPVTVSALKSADGQTLLMLHTTNPFVDRDKEIFAEAAIKAYAAAAAPGSPVDYWHTPWTVGRVAWTGYGEKALFELVEPSGDVASREFVALVAADPAGWGCSHRFHYAPADKAGGVFTRLDKEKSTILPARVAANPFTAVAGLSAKEVKAMDQQKLQDLAGKLSPAAFEQAKAFIAGEEDKARRLVEAGVAHKETETPPAAAPAPAPNPDAAALATALKAVIDPLQAQVAALNAQVTALQAADKARAELPRAANFFGTVPASRDPQTALTPEQVAAAALLGPGQKASGEDDDPMLRSMQLMFGARS